MITKKQKLLSMIAAILLLSMILCSCGALNNSDKDTEDTADTDNTTTTEPFIPLPLYENFVIFDGDGDGVKDHVARHNTMGMSGGHGSYDLFIYEKADSRSYEKIFDGEEYLSAHKNMDLQVSKGTAERTVIFSHEGLGYSGEYTVTEHDYQYIFDTAPDGAETINLTVDTFKAVTPVNVDGDEGEELEMRQYVSLGYHSNYVGDCVTLWDVKEGSLELIDIKMIFFYDTEE